MPRIKSVFRSRSGSTWASFLIRAAPIFGLPPLIFSSFNETDASIWFVLITLQGMQFLIASSIGQPLIRAYSFALGGASHIGDMRNPGNVKTDSPNLSLISKIWGVSLYSHIIVSLITLAVLASLGVYSVYGIVDDVNHSLNVWVSLLVFLFVTTLKSFDGQNISYLIGMDKIPLLRWTEAFFWSLSFCLTVVAIVLNATLLISVCAYSIPIIANVLVNAFLCRRIAVKKAINIRAPKFDWTVAMQLWSQVWRTGLGTVSFISATQGAGLVYAGSGNSENVAGFLFAMSIIRPLGQFAQVPFLTKIPTLSRLQVTHQRHEQVEIAKKSMALSYALHASLVVAVAVALPYIFLFSNSNAPVALSLWLLIGISGFLERIGAMHIQLYSITNNVIIHLANGLTAIVYVVASLLLFQNFGLYALPLSQIISLVLVYIPISVLHSYTEFKLDFPKFELHSSFIPFTFLILFSLIAQH